MPTLHEQIQAFFRIGGPAGWYALDVALRAAREAGRKALKDNPRLPEPERFAVALQAAQETLDGLALEMSGTGTVEQ
jgi:hypothetical protein